MAKFHVRSISLPSSSHPVILSIEEQLQKLKASKSQSPCHKLDGLKNLYECVDDLLQLPVIQQTLSNELQREFVEDLLNGSLRLLDICSTTRDCFSQTKECVKELELSIRRKRRRQSGLTAEIVAYIASRKKHNKVIYKLLQNLKINKKCLSSSAENISNLVTILIHVQEISLPVFESMLSFISQPKTKTKPSGWSMVSRLLQSKRVSCEGKVDSYEIEKIDAELLILKSSKDTSFGQVQNVLKRLEPFGSSIQEVEEELECVYRRLVKTRVSLLNILNR